MIIYLPTIKPNKIAAPALNKYNILARKKEKIIKKIKNSLHVNKEIVLIAMQTQSKSKWLKESALKEN